MMSIHDIANDNYSFGNDGYRYSLRDLDSMSSERLSHLLIKELVKNRSGEEPYENIRRLLECGAHLDSEEVALPLAAKEGYLKVCELLLEYGADINLSARFHTPLTAAAIENKLDVLVFLVSRGADIHQRDNTGLTALYQASNYGSYDAVNFLITQGAEIDFQDDLGCTALHMAAIGGHLGIVTLLVQNGAKADMKNKRGLTPLLYAKISNKAESGDIIDFLSSLTTA